MKSRESVSAAWLVVLLAFGLAGCAGRETSRPPASETLSGFRVQALRWETVPDEIEAPGTVVAAATARVAARTMGTAIEVLVREGDRVKRGQLLVRLDERELAARHNAAQAALAEAAAGGEEAARALAAAEAQATLAQKTYQRFVSLREQNSVSAQEFDEVEAKNRAAQAALAQARARQEQVAAMHERAESEAGAAEAVASYARVVAPFDGLVVRRSVDPGTMVAPGMPLMVVEDNSRYRLEVTLAAQGFPSGLRRGTSARVRVDGLPGVELTGKVVEVEAGADPASHTLRARIELPPNPATRSGLFGRAWFQRGQRRALALPRSGVLEHGQLRGVYALDSEGVARWRLVTLGAELSDGRVEILSGVGEGDRIVLDPGTKELEGKRILAAVGAAGEAIR